MAPLYNTRETFSNTALYTSPHRSSSSKDAPPHVCPICAEPCADATPIKSHHALKMPSCDHIFGASCIETWFDSASTCPLCRQDFFPTHPEEISQELKEMPDLVEEALGVLQQMRDRYPQGRHAVDKIESSLASFADMVGRDCAERNARKSERGLFERRRHQMRVWGTLAEHARQDGTVDGQVTPPDEPATAPSSDTTPPAPSISTPSAPPQLPDPILMWEFITLQAEAILAHDFTLDLQSVTRTGQVDPGSDFFSIMDLAQDVRHLAEEHGLLEIATAISRRCISVNRAISDEQRRLAAPPASMEMVERHRREEELRRAACVENGPRRPRRRGFWGWCRWRR